MGLAVHVRPIAHSWSSVAVPVLRMSTSSRWSADGSTSVWGVRRTSPRFWSTLDWLQDRLNETDRREAGLLDWNRYANW